MTDVNFSRMTAAELQNYDFRTNNQQNRFDADRINTLMNQEGAFTLDDQGQLQVINPPARRDNRFVRFIKGLFSSSYKTQQANLDRMENLQKNTSFNQILRESLVKAMTGKEVPSADNVNENQSKRARILSLQLRDRFENNNGRVSISDIKQASKNTDSFINSISLAANTIQDNKISGSSIAFKGEALSPLDFIKKFDGGMANNDKKLLSSILLRAARFPESFACIGKTEQARELSRLFAKPGFGGTYENADVNDRAKAQSLLREIVSEVNKKMCAFAEGAMASGKDPAAVAAKLKENYNALCAPFRGNTEGVNVLNQVLGENGSLAKTDELAPAQDPEAYTVPDPSSKNYDSFMKLKQELPDLSNRQLAQIVNFLAGKCKDNSIDAKTLNKYIAGVKSGGDKIFRKALQDLQDAASRCNPAVLKKTGQDLLKLFMDTTGVQKITDVHKDKIASFSAMIMHYVAITAPADELKSISIDNLKDLYAAMGNNTVFNSDGLDPETKLVMQRHASECGCITSLLDEVRNVLMPATDNFASFDADEVPKNMDLMVKTTLIMGQTEYPKFQAQIDEAASAFPENMRSPIKAMLADLVKAKLSVKYNDSGAIIKSIADTMKKSEMFMNLMNVRNVSQEDLNAYKNAILSHEVLKNNFKHHIEVKNVTQNTFHNNTDRDLKGMMTGSINGIDLSAMEKQQRIDTFRKELTAKVPQNMIGFITTYIQQGGMAGEIAENRLKPENKLRISPNFPTFADGCKHHLITNNDTVHNIKTDGNIIEIATDVTIQGGPDQYFAMTDPLKNGGLYDLTKFTVVAKIDISKGTDEIGFPKGLEISIAKKEV